MNEGLQHSAITSFEIHFHVIPIEKKMYEYVLELGRYGQHRGNILLTSTCVCECAIDLLISTLGGHLVATILLLLLFLNWRQLPLFFFFLLLLVLLRLHGPDQAPPPPPLVEEGHVPEGVTLAEIPNDRLFREIRLVL